jgi:hypothetical protein
VKKFSAREGTAFVLVEGRYDTTNEGMRLRVESISIRSISISAVSEKIKKINTMQILFLLRL